MDREKNVLSNNRIIWVDIAKFICISFVLFSHMEYVPIYLKVIFKPFFLTTFFFLTGYTFSIKKDFGDFFKKRISTLLLPALLFSVIYLLDFNDILKGNYSIAHLINDMSPLLRQQRGNGDVLWFLYVCFLSEIPLFILLKKFNRNIVAIISSVLFIASFVYVKFFMNEVPYWYIHIVFVAMWFMVLGYEYRIYEEQINKIFEFKFVLIEVAIFILSILFSYYSYGSYININEYEAPFILWILAVFTGIILCIFISKNIGANKMINYVGSNTIIFYLLHDRVRKIFNIIYIKCGIWEYIQVNFITQTIACIVTYILELMVLILATKFILRFVPFIVGRKKKKER